MAKSESTILNILTYHSISSCPGPTSIPATTFREHLDALERQGFSVVSLRDFVAWRNGERDLSPRCSIITFDDGFEDFRETAFPALQNKGWSATVFLPTDRVGSQEDWVGHDTPPRRLMSWSTIQDLASQGIEFGAHTRTHPDLTRIPIAAACEEIHRSKEEIEEYLGTSTSLPFAAPYGRSNAEIRREIRKSFAVSVGTKLARAGRDCDLYDVPRLEMHYFRDLRRWHAFLEGRGELYFAVRRVLRRVRELIPAPAPRSDARAM